MSYSKTYTTFSLLYSNQRLRKRKYIYSINRASSRAHAMYKHKGIYLHPADICSGQISKCWITNPNKVTHETVFQPNLALDKCLRVRTKNIFVFPNDV